jgi:hypothetical protein
MANTIFQFKILNGDDPQAQYDAIVTKDPMTFYLLSTGIGYFGEVPLFGGGANRTVVIVSDVLTEPEPGKLYILKDAEYGINTLTGLYFYDGTNMACFSDELMATYIRGIIVKDMLAENYEGDDETFATTKAIVDLINHKLETAVVLRDVKSHTLTYEDTLNTRITIPEGVEVGETGLLFTVYVGNMSTVDDERYCFISLSEYMCDVFGTTNSDSIKVTLTEDSEVKAELIIKEGEESLKIDHENGGVYVEKTEDISENTPSAIKLVTEESLVQYMTSVILPRVQKNLDEALKDVVRAKIDNMNHSVAIAGQIFDSLTEAIEAVTPTTEIYLVSDTASEGVIASSGKIVSIDLGGNELVLAEPFVGSPGTTKQLAFQFLKDSDITIKNGIIKAEDALFVIQNYSNLILDNVTVIGSKKNTYLLSNNYGNIILRNGTKLITAPGSKTVAFDLYYGLRPEYDDGVTLTIEDQSVIIDGPIEYGKAARASEEGLIANCKLTVPLGYMLEAPAGYEWVDNSNGTQTLKLITT